MKQQIRHWYNTCYSWLSFTITHFAGFCPGPRWDADACGGPSHGAEHDSGAGPYHRERTTVHLYSCQSEICLPKYTAYCNRGKGLITAREPLYICIAANLKSAFLNTLRIAIEVWLWSHFTSLENPLYIYIEENLKTGFMLPAWKVRGGRLVFVCCLSVHLFVRNSFPITKCNIKFLGGHAVTKLGL